MKTYHHIKWLAARITKRANPIQNRKSISKYHMSKSTTGVVTNIEFQFSQNKQKHNKANIESDPIQLLIRMKRKPMCSTQTCIASTKICRIVQNYTNSNCVAPQRSGLSPRISSKFPFCEINRFTCMYLMNLPRNE